MYNLGAVAVEQNRLTDAHGLLSESVTAAGRLGDHEDVAWCLIALAAIASRTNQMHAAARTLGFAIALLERIGATMKPFESGLCEDTRQALGAALGANEVDSLLIDGARLELDAVLEFALKFPTPQAPRPQPVGTTGASST